MSDNINISEGASIGGNVDSGGGKVVGRDDNSIINNIVIVGRFLEFAQIEELLPRLEHKQGFASIVDAIEGNIASRLDDDLADAVAWVGAILGEFLKDWIMRNNLSDVDVPISLASLLQQLIVHVGEELKDNGYWREWHEPQIKMIFDEVHGHVVITDEILWLDTTTKLFNHYWRNSVKRIGIFKNDTSYWQIDDWQDYENPVYRLTTEPVAAQKVSLNSLAQGNFTSSQLRIIIAGIVLDLIRIKSDNTISAQFLQSLADVFKPLQ